MSETLPIVDNDGVIIGSADRALCHDGQSMLLHPVVHLHIIKNGKSILLQKRSLAKKIQPGKWDTCVGGHIAYGEDPKIALIREAKEEVGIDASKAKLHTTYLFTSPIEHEFVYVYLLDYNELAEIDNVKNDEVDELNFFTFDEIKGESFTPNLLWEIDNILRLDII